jgi:hypothetical protein
VGLSPVRCVVDTNVATTANRLNAGASDACVAASARALQGVMREGHVFVDNAGEIVAEYCQHLSRKGEPGPGDAFLKWLLQHEWGGQRVTRVTITAKSDDPEDFEELPAPDDGTTYDRSDRKFLAVAAAHSDRPHILQSFDSKWWGWQASLGKCGVSIHFLCPDEIRAKHAAKMGS